MQRVQQPLSNFCGLDPESICLSIMTYCEENHTDIASNKSFRVQILEKGKDLKRENHLVRLGCFVVGNSSYYKAYKT